MCFYSFIVLVCVVSSIATNISIDAITLPLASIFLLPAILLKCYLLILRNNFESGGDGSIRIMSLVKLFDSMNIIGKI